MSGELNPTKDENLVFVTLNGVCITVKAPDESDIRKHGDRIHEIVSDVMKTEEHRDGLWVWSITRDWSLVCGIPVDDD